MTLDHHPIPGREGSVVCHQNKNQPPILLPVLQTEKAVQKSEACFMSVQA